MSSNGVKKRTREDDLSNTADDEHFLENDEGKTSECKIESGPKFHINERVLVLDSTRSQQQSNQTIENNEPPLFEATIKRSELRHVDPLTRKVMSETKFAFSKKRGRRRFHSQHSTQQISMELDLEKEWCYLIHFQGWNSRHDRWMTEGEVFHNTPENRKRLGSNTTKIARAIKVESAKEKKKKIARTKKANEEQDGNGESMRDPNLSLFINACDLPFTLQTILADDRDKITQKVYPSSSLFAPENPMEIYKKGINMLHVLPSMMSIESILTRFVEVKKREDLEMFVKDRGHSSENNQDVVKNSEKQEHRSTDNDQTMKAQSNKLSSKFLLKIRKKKRKEFALSILGLVNVALPKFLLYNEERQQYVQVMSAGGGDRKKNDTVANDVVSKATKRPSEIYGGEHLLRIFVRLPYLLTLYHKTDTDTAADQSSENIPTVEEQFVTLAGFLSEFIVYLQKYRDECFKERYYAVSSNKC